MNKSAVCCRSCCFQTRSGRPAFNWRGTEQVISAQTFRPLPGTHAMPYQALFPRPCSCLTIPSHPIPAPALQHAATAAPCAKPWTVAPSTASAASCPCHHRPAPHPPSAQPSQPPRQQQAAPPAPPLSASCPWSSARRRTSCCCCSSSDSSSNNLQPLPLPYSRAAAEQRQQPSRHSSSSSNSPQRRRQPTSRHLRGRRWAPWC